MGELGNTMPLALANLLSSPLLIFTSLETMPVLLITPSLVRDAIPRIYLAFNQYGQVITTLLLVATVRVRWKNLGSRDRL